MDRDAVLNWLLKEDNPPVRLLTLTRLLHRTETDAEVQEARTRLMDYSVTQGILAHSDEIWQSGPRAFWSYKGKHWNTVYLGHFLADGQDLRIAGGVQALLGHGWVRDTFHCMTVCMLTAFRRLGYGDHPVVVEGTEALAQRLLDDGGVACRPMNNSPALGRLFPKGMRLRRRFTAKVWRLSFLPASRFWTSCRAIISIAAAVSYRRCGDSVSGTACRRRLMLRRRAGKSRNFSSAIFRWMSSASNPAG